MLLRDLPTPAFLIDVQALQSRVDNKHHQPNGRCTATTTADSSVVGNPIPSILLPTFNQQLVATSIGDNSSSVPHIFDSTLDPIAILQPDWDWDNGGDDATSGTTIHATSKSASGVVCFGYIHCTVVAPSKPTSSDASMPSVFLVQLDIPMDLPTDAHLVLGVNNHHVGSYYWARSTGAGAAMEAPGIVWNKRQGSLEWKSDQFTDCNSNDGKRSEWVPFLRTGDQVQLRPTSTASTTTTRELSPEAAVMALSPHIYGISSKNRPLGSEPVVVCKWKIEPRR